MLPDRTSTSEPADADRGLTARVRARDQAAFETLMRRHNGRLFRVARAILKDDAEAEDALQDAYLDAYRHIEAFRGDAALATWLTYRRQSDGARCDRIVSDVLARIDW